MASSSSKEIISKIENNQTSFNNVVIIGEGHIENISIQYLHFKQCTFKDNISFTNLDINKLIFEDCSFEKWIKVHNVNIKEDLLFNNCNSLSNLTVCNCKTANINILNSKFDKFELSGKVENQSLISDKIIIENSTFAKLSLNNFFCYQKLNVINVDTEEISFSKSVFYTDIMLGHYDNKYVNSPDFYIDSSEFRGRIDFYEGSCETLYIKNTSFKEQVVLKSKFNAKSVSLVHIQSLFDFNIEYCDNIENLNLSNCNFNSTFEIRPSYNEYPTEPFRIDFAETFQGTCFIDNVPTSNIGLSGLNQGNIIIENVDVQFIWISNFYNSGKFIINNINNYLRYYQLFAIQNSNLGNAEFINIDFSNFTETVILNCNISDITLTNSLFPKKIQIESKEPKIGINAKVPQKKKYLFLRESYRQLKLAMEKSGNKYYYLLYKSKEMYYQRKELKLWNKNTFWDKLLLSINWLSNNHGISWVRAIFFTLFCAFISFILLEYQSDKSVFTQMVGSTWDNSKNIVGAFINYISTYPILKVEGLDENDWKINLTILLSRIFVSVGVYQILISFRKYSSN